MSDPDPQPPPMPPPAADAPRGAATRTLRNGCVWLVLIPLIGWAVAETAGLAGRAPDGWAALARATPLALMTVGVQAGVAFAVALLVHARFPQVGLWLAVIAAAAVAVGVATSGFIGAGSWAAFALLLNLAALEAIPRTLDDAAAVDRVRGWLKFRTITLPLALPLLLTGLAFLTVLAYRPSPGDVRLFIAAHALLIGAIAAGAALARDARR